MDKDKISLEDTIYRSYGLLTNCRKITLEETEKLLSNVINNDEFFEIETKDGIAVVINEREWKILIDSLGGEIKEE